MAIKNLKFEGSELLKEGEISFANNNIASVIGMNGSGKTILMNHIKEKFNHSWVKQIVLKSDAEKIEKGLKEIFNVGTDSKKFKEFFATVKKDNLKLVSTVRGTLDDFIWERFLFANQNVIKANFEDMISKTIIKKIKALSKTKMFSQEVVKNEIPELSNLIIFDKYEEATNSLSDIFNKHFNRTKIITVDTNNEPIFENHLQTNSLSKYSLSSALRNGDQLFVRLMRVAGINSSQLNEICHSEKSITKKHNSKINNWFKSYISQNLEIAVTIEGNYYEIEILEDNNLLDFNDLSTGTKNLFKIISQIENVNSETIIQLDEPETGMHPIMQIQFREFLEDMSNKFDARFIIYTHSTYIVKNGINTRGLYIMSRNNSVSTLMSKEEYVKNKDILDIQIYENVGYSSMEESYYKFDNTKKIIIVEGETDVIYVKKMAALFKKGDYEIIRTKVGGATTIESTITLLEAVHNFSPKNIIASPDLDIKTKHPKIHSMLMEREGIKYVPLGLKERQEVEGMFDYKDRKYVGLKTSNNNTKMNKANLFWRSVTKKTDLSKETIDNWEKYFKKLEKKTK